MENIIALFIPIIAITAPLLTILGGLWIGLTARTRNKELEVRRIEALARLVDASARIGSLPLPDDQKDAVAAEINAALNEAESRPEGSGPVPMRVEKEL